MIKGILVWTGMVLSVLVSVSVVPTATSALEPSASPIPAVNSKAYLSDFNRAQRSEFKALEHRHKLDLKELKSTQKVKLQEWEKQEKEARHRFFSEHPKGSDRRVYIQDFLRRREALKKQQKDDYALRVQEQDASIKAMQQIHSEKLKEFQQFISTGQAPPAHLWPQPGH